jgi:hypothetical protein
MVNHMQLSPSLATHSFSSNKEIPNTLWNQNIRYRDHRSPPPIPMLSQMNPVIYRYFLVASFLQKCCMHISFNLRDLIILVTFGGRPQWSRGLTHEPSSPAWTLGSWVRIPLDVWTSVCVYSVFVLFASLRVADPLSKESYRLCIGSRNWKSGQGPTKGCSATESE